MQQLINDILHDMSEVLSAKELYALQIVLQKKLNTQNQTYPYTNIEYMDMFISAKRIEGCSERTLAYYKATIEHMLSIIVTPLRQVNTDELSVNVNIRMYNFDDVQCTVIPSVAYGFVTGMNLQLC